MDRPWELDPIPLVLVAGRVGAARARRSRSARACSTAILADLYGAAAPAARGAAAARARVRATRLPAAVSRLRAARRLLPPRSTPPTSRARRRPAGGCSRDRTQAPSGAGYALENRIVLSRMLPEAFRDCHVAAARRLLPAPARHAAHAGAAPPRQPAHRAARRRGRTTRPTSSTPTSRATSASRSSRAATSPCATTRVYLKTLGGLEPRRRDPAPPGRRVLRSARAARRLVARRRRASCRRCAPATSWSRTRSAAAWSRSPALIAFLPGLCRALLGEELALPSVATWWCGHADALAYVDRAPRRARDQAGVPGAARMEPVFGGRARRSRARGAGRARARAPARVRRRRSRSRSRPRRSGRGERVQPRHLVLRVFAVAAATATCVMPGGLTRVSTVARLARRLDAARRRQQGHLGACASGRRARSRLLRAGRRADRAHARRRRAAEPRRRQPVLARPLHRARRGHARASRRGVLGARRRADERASASVALLEPLLPARSGATRAAPETLRPGDEARVLAALFDARAPRALRATVAALHRLAWLAARPDLARHLARARGARRRTSPSPQTPIRTARRASAMLNG